MSARHRKYNPEGEQRVRIAAEIEDIGTSMTLSCTMSSGTMCQAGTASSWPRLVAAAANVTKTRASDLRTRLEGHTLYAQGLSNGAEAHSEECLVPRSWFCFASLTRAQ